MGNDKPLVFEDLAQFDDCSIEKILREAGRESIAVALRGAGEKLKTKFYRNMSPRVAAMIREDFYTPACRREEERRNILKTASRLAESGEIALPIMDRFQHTDDGQHFLIKQIEQELQSGDHLSLCQPGKISRENIQLVRTFLEDRKDALRRIRRLYVHNGFLSAVEVFSSIGRLESLYITETEKLPDWIGNLTSLKILILSRTNISTLPESVTNLVNLTVLDVSGTPLTELPENIGNLAGLTSLNVSRTSIKTLPESIAALRSLVWLNITGTGITEMPKSLLALPNLVILNFRGLGTVKLLPKHEMNWDEFVSGYYKSVQTLWRCSEQAFHEGLCGLKTDIDALAAQGDDFFSLGMRLVIEGTDGAVIREILSVTAEQEHDPYKQKLKQILCEGILGIQAGEPSIRLITRLDSFVNIPDNEVRNICREYNASGDRRTLNRLDGIRYDLPAEREEIRFIRRVVTLSDKARREGILSLEAERDFALFAEDDIFEYALPLVIDGEKPEYISSLLDNMIESEHDPWKRKLMRAKKTAALSIQTGENSRVITLKLLSYFDSHVRDLVK